MSSIPETGYCLFHLHAQSARVFLVVLLHTVVCAHVPLALSWDGLSPVVRHRLETARKEVFSRVKILVIIIIIIKLLRRQFLLWKYEVLSVILGQSFRVCSSSVVMFRFKLVRYLNLLHLFVGHKIMKPQILECNFTPDSTRGCENYNDYFNVTFQALFLDEPANPEYEIVVVPWQLDKPVSGGGEKLYYWLSYI